MQDAQKLRRFRRSVGLLLAIAGFVGDGLAGMFFLAHMDIEIFIWHIPAALLWALGVNLVTLPDVQPDVASDQPSLEREQRRSRRYVSRLGIVALFLGLGTFPGFGALAYSIALAMGHISRALSTRTLPTEALLPAAISPVPAELSPSFDWNVQPLMVDLQASDVETRRLSLATLSRYVDPETTRLLRQLLADSQMEVRSDASIALSRLEDQFSHSLNIALERWMAQPNESALALALAEECYHYACSNILDQTSQHFYLSKARDLLLQVVSQESRNAELWLKLARIRQRLGEFHEAFQDTQVALHLSSESSEASMLAMELAFRLHAWDMLMALADKSGELLSAQPSSLASLQWWANLHSATQEGVTHG